MPGGADRSCAASVKPGEGVSCHAGRGRQPETRYPESHPHRARDDQAAWRPFLDLASAFGASLSDTGV